MEKAVTFPQEHLRSVHDTTISILQLLPLCYAAKPKDIHLERKRDKNLGRQVYLRV